MREWTRETVDAIRRRARPTAPTEYVVNSLWQDTRVLLERIEQLESGDSEAQGDEPGVKSFDPEPLWKRLIVLEGFASSLSRVMTQLLSLEKRELVQRTALDRTSKMLAQVGAVQGKHDQEIGRMVTLGARLEKSLAETDAMVAQLMKKASSVASPQITHLMGFYNVSSIENLVTEQAAHIERLQAKMRPYPPGDDGSSPRSG